MGIFQVCCLNSVAVHPRRLAGFACPILTLDLMQTSVTWWILTTSTVNLQLLQLLFILILEFDFYCEGIPHDEDGICRESISISFDFGYRSLARDIKQSETMIKREEFVKPEWVRRQMFDFNAPIGNLQLPGVNRNEVEQSFVEFLNGFEVDWTKLDDSQREALIGMTMNSGFGLIVSC
jgi:hypothetical protein